MTVWYKGEEQDVRPRLVTRWSGMASSERPHIQSDSESKSWGQPFEQPGDECCTEGMAHAQAPKGKT